jgi:glycosyltransferase involved in cell wall biosynthesis
MTRVSIVIPVYNAEKYLDECIKSALDQTYHDIEVIAVNDGSTDNSLEILKKYADRIKIISKPNGGMGSALNVGISKMTGEWFKILGADDVLYPYAVEELVKVTEKLENKNNFILFSNYDVIDEQGKIFSQYICPNYNEMDQFKVNTILLDHHIGIAITSLIHKSAFERCGNYDENFRGHEDYELWLRLCIQYNFRLYLVPKVLVKWRVHKEQLTIINLRIILKRMDETRNHILSKIDPQLKEKYNLALKTYKKKISIRLRTRKVLGNIMFKLLPDSIATKLLKFYWSKRGLQ